MNIAFSRARRVALPLPLLATLAGLAPASAMAADATLELLAQKGIITADEYARLKAGQQDQAQVSLKDGLKITSGDGRSSVQIGALLQLDAAHFQGSDGKDYGDGSELRRARLSLGGSSGAWDFRLETELSPNATQGVTDAWAAWRGPVTVTAGNFKIPYSLEALMSDKNLAFMERSLSSAFLPSRAPGVMIGKAGTHWSVVGGVFGEPLSTATTDDEGGGFSTRATWAPFIASGRALHLGGSLHWRQPSQSRDAKTGKGVAETLRLSSKPEMNLFPDRLIDTGNIAGDVDDSTVAALELAATRGPLTAQAEYTRAQVSRTRDADLRFSGGYVQLGWALTGETRAYKAETGVLDGIKPNGKVAWELAARLSDMDLSDGGVDGGRERNASAALNVYFGPNVKVGLNYVDVLLVKGGAMDGKEPSAVMLRTQFSY